MTMPAFTQQQVFSIPHDIQRGDPETEVAARWGVTVDDVRRVCSAREMAKGGSWNDFVAAIERTYA